MNNQINKKLVEITSEGIAFGNAWYSHESITGYAAEQLNSRNYGITGRAYMEWLNAAPIKLQVQEFHPEVLASAPLMEQRVAETGYPMNPAKYWNGQQGDQYRERQDETKLIRSYRHMWLSILDNMPIPPKTILEFGANVGLNLDVLKNICPDAVTYAVEPNAGACIELRRKGHNAIQVTIQEYVPIDQRELTFTRGVLIHTPPSDLPDAYAKLYASSSRHIVIAEYYNPTPMEIEYRGQKGLLWKRDFAGEMMDKYPDLRLIDYGFIYKRDPQYQQDDVTYFLMEKK